MNIKNVALLAFQLLWSINTLIAQQFLNNTLLHDGETREYTVYIPSSYDGNTTVPLLFNFHGGGGDIASQIAIADMRPIADTAKFILVYPQALPDPNDGGSTNWLHKEPTTVDDIFFVEAMIDTIISQYEINEGRVYACGYSLGGEFTYELACRLSSRIAAVGVVARTMGTGTFNNCSPTHPTGIITILGTEDWISPYDGLFWGGIQYYLSADEVHNYWSSYNNTSSQPIVTQLPNLNQSDGSTVEHYWWGNGDQCVSVEHLKVIGGGHDWPGTFGNMDIDASSEIWNFVSKYNLDGLINCSITSVYEAIKEIRFYPNPVVESITIDMDLTVNQEYRIYSTIGELMISGKIDPENKTINLSDLPANIYFLSINNKTLKFIKTK